MPQDNPFAQQKQNSINKLPFWKAFWVEKLQNFDVKSNSEKRFTFIQKNSEYAVNKQKKIIKNGKNFSLIG